MIKKKKEIIGNFKTCLWAIISTFFICKSVNYQFVFMQIIKTILI